MKKKKNQNKNKAITKGKENGKIILNLNKAPLIKRRSQLELHPS